MKEQLSQILSAALAEVEHASSKAELEAARVKYLGKKGELTAILRGMGKLSAEERPVIGPAPDRPQAADRDHRCDAARPKTAFGQAPSAEHCAV